MFHIYLLLLDYVLFILLISLKCFAIHVQRLSDNSIALSAYCEMLTMHYVTNSHKHT